MKKVANVVEVDGEWLVGLLGEYVVLFCANYIYAGMLEGVNDVEVLLEDASIVYETGPLCGPLKDAQKLPSNLYVRLSSVESYYKK